MIYVPLRKARNVVFAFLALLGMMAFGAVEAKAQSLPPSQGCNLIGASALSINDPYVSSSAFAGFAFTKGEILHFHFQQSVPLQVTQVEVVVNGPPQERTFPIPDPGENASIDVPILETGLHPVVRWSRNGHEYYPLAQPFIVTVTCTPAPLPPPTLDSLSADSGPAAGGNVVTLTGSYFTSTSTVEIDGITVDASDVTFVGDTELSVVMPAATPGSKTITVTNAAGTGNGLPYTYDPPPSGTVSIRVVAGGEADESFGFSSATGSLNLSIPTMGGVGNSAPVTLDIGTYQITAADMSAAGFALSSVSCSDADSSGDVTSRTASITLDANEAIICTFAMTNSREDTL